MIAVDTSALVAIAFREPERTLFVDAIAGQSSIIGAPVLVEAGMVLRSRFADAGDAFIDRMVREKKLVPEPFTFDMYLAARDAFARYGRGTGHPARLNFGDCLSYAVAKVRGLPLLYKGRGFAETDIVAAVP